MDFTIENLVKLGGELDVRKFVTYVEFPNELCVSFQHGIIKYTCISHRGHLLIYVEDDYVLDDFKNLLKGLKINLPINLESGTNCKRNGDGC